jgi:hypothetical protein
VSNAGWGVGGGKRPVVFVTSRVHPGETPASYVAQVRTQWLFFRRVTVLLIEAITLSKERMKLPLAAKFQSFMLPGCCDAGYKVL